jgi:hypothetical protein
MRSATVSWEVNSHYTPVKCLGNSQLSEPSLFEKNDMIENMKYLQHESLACQQTLL